MRAIEWARLCAGVRWFVHLRDISKTINAHRVHGVSSEQLWKQQSFADGKLVGIEFDELLFALRDSGHYRVTNKTWYPTSAPPKRTEPRRRRRAKEDERQTDLFGARR